jgi:hypothetical protein
MLWGGGWIGEVGNQELSQREVEAGKGGEDAARRERNESLVRRLRHDDPTDTMLQVRRAEAELLGIKVAQINN